MGKAFGILVKTFPYLLIRAAAYIAFGAISLLYTAIVIGLIAAVGSVLKDNGAWIIIILIIAGLGGFAGLWRLAERLVFYAIKAGHVAVITELITKGNLPAGVNQVEFGRQVVTKHFGTMAAFAAVDLLVEAAVRQVLGWLTTAVGMLDFIPGIRTLWSIARRILYVAGNYVDEAILSYILIHPAENIWKCAADGVVLYAQAWKKLIVAATVVVIVVGVVWLVAAVPFFLASSAILAAFGSSLQLEPDAIWWLALIPAAIAGGIANSIVGDPVATVLMVVAYQEAVTEETPSVDMYGKLTGASKKFAELAGKAQQPEPVVVPNF